MHPCAHLVGATSSVVTRKSLDSYSEQAARRERTLLGEIVKADEQPEVEIAARRVLKPGADERRGLGVRRRPCRSAAAGAEVGLDAEPADDRHLRRLLVLAVDREPQVAARR